jgi:hypothetical protein
MSQPESFQEPKQFNTIALLEQRNHIKVLIDNKLHAAALQEMCSLVCEFELTLKDTDMEKLKKELMDNYTNPSKGIASFEDMKYFDKINAYMNKTYFKGFKAPMGEEMFKELDGENDNASKETES